MPSYAYERLSARDHTLLLDEGPNTYMHVTGAAVDRTGPFAARAGGFDIDAFRRVIRSLLPAVPRYRQKLRWPGRGAPPVWVDDPDFRAIRDVTELLEESRQALAAELMLAAADWAPSFLLSLGARALARPLPAHLMVSNVPGPQRPLYMNGAEMLAVYPLVPLMPHTGLGVAVFSYNGTLFWGLNAEPDLLPDLPLFRRALEASLESLAQAAGVKLQVPVAEG